MIHGFKIGHYSDYEGGTGTTVIIAENGAVGGVDVRGSAPGTRETDLLKGCKAVEKINAVCLSGGSAFGLEACDGVMLWLAEHEKGYFTGTRYVPIVCGAVIYDLDYKAFAYPDKKSGYAACACAAESFETGSVGAGVGATVGKIFGMDNCCKGGVGYAEISVGEAVVGAIVVTNSFGDVIDIEKGGSVVAGAKKDGVFVGTADYILKNAVSGLKGGVNTTIGCVFTDAVLTREQANKLAEAAHNGLALSVSPVHTMLDGDTMFVMAGCEKTADFTALTCAVPLAVRKAVLSAVKK